MLDISVEAAAVKVNPLVDQEVQAVVVMVHLEEAAEAAALTVVEEVVLVLPLVDLVVLGLS